MAEKEYQFVSVEVWNLDVIQHDLAILWNYKLDKRVVKYK